MPKNWRASEENETAHKFLKDNSANIKVDDTIEFEPGNQMDYVKYKVILNDKGEKDLEEIASYASTIDKNDDDDDETKSGGKRRRRRKTKRAKKSKRKRKTRRGKKR
jgi:hypothetical protein